MLEESHEPLKFGGGPLGLGDPDDKRLRHIEKTVILHKMFRDEAQKKCGDTLKEFQACAKEAGFGVIWKCKGENRENEECLLKWIQNPEFVEAITNKYLEARSHYRRTGETVMKYERVKGTKSAFC